MKVHHRITEADHSLLADRAAAPLSAEPRPFLKWAGSKRRFLPMLLRHIPRRFGRYFEPFLGGGALFFLLRPQSAVLADACAELIETYEAVRNNPSAVCRYIKPLRPDKDLYYSIRGQRSVGRYKRAAEFIYLNKMCWNGLYRVNKRGEFNVPFGRPRSDYVADDTNIRSCSAALATDDVRLTVSDFEGALENAARGDLVFLDPPYVTGHQNNGFIDYNETLFSWDDQRRLADVAKELRAKGVHVLVTNADHPSIINLYGGFVPHRLSSHSTISGKNLGRRRTSELLLVAKERSSK